MAHGQCQGMTAHSPDLRQMFTRDYLLASDWYQQRLRTRQQREQTLWQRHVNYLTDFIKDRTHADDNAPLGLESRLQRRGRNWSACRRRITCAR
jgi:hypothetical protein